MTPVALMYHGVASAVHPLSAMRAEDRPYAVTADTLARHLSLCSGKPVLVTFDDGDAGWYYSALPSLARANVTALFFVTPALVGTPGYCSWEQLKALADAGHRLGTHGLTHRFLPDLDDDACRRELVESKVLLEQRLGINVDSVSFPGGRYGARELRLARAAGYAHCYSSVPGKHDARAFCRRRVAIRAQTGDAWLEKLLSGEPRVWLRLRVVYAIKAIVRKLIGNRGYHALYRIARG